jgi:hypothetical protein
MINQTYMAFYSIIKISHFKMSYKLFWTKILAEIKFKNIRYNFNKLNSIWIYRTTRLIFESKDMPFLVLKTK